MINYYKAPARTCSTIPIFRTRLQICNPKHTAMTIAEKFCYICHTCISSTRIIYVINIGVAIKTYIFSHTWRFDFNVVIVIDITHSSACE